MGAHSHLYGRSYCSVWFGLLRPLQAAPVLVPTPLNSSLGRWPVLHWDTALFSYGRVTEIYIEFLQWISLLHTVLILITRAGTVDGHGIVDSAWDSRALRALDSSLCSVERIAAKALPPERFQAEFQVHAGAAPFNNRLHCESTDQCGALF